MKLMNELKASLIPFETEEISDVTPVAIDESPEIIA
jgi:hypothetical protein